MSASKAWPNVPPPGGKPQQNNYSRFIPREELSGFSAWMPGDLQGELGTPDQPVRLQPLEGLPHRGAAEAEIVGEARFGEQFARPEGQLEDAALDLAICLTGNRLSVQPLRIRH